MRFYNQSNQLVFEDPSQYPAARPVALQQISDRSAGNTIHVETFASPIENRTLVFDQMNHTDYTGLLDWFINKVNGMAETFFFEDERGDTFTVRFTTPTINFPETSYHRYSGTVPLEIV